jgi:hypothetical protein
LRWLQVPATRKSRHVNDLAAFLLIRLLAFMNVNTVSTKAMAPPCRHLAAQPDWPSTETFNPTTGIDPATFTEEATTRSARQAAPAGFGFQASGSFHEATNAVIVRWHAARGYPAFSDANLEVVQSTGGRLMSQRHRRESARAQKCGGSQ